MKMLLFKKTKFSKPIIFLTTLQQRTQKLTVVINITMQFNICNLKNATRT